MCRTRTGWRSEGCGVQGAIVIGKTNVPEFGLGSHTYNPIFGATGNAWNPAFSAGGSSGGGAVAVAQRMLPMADGSDLGGSLRNPAGWNNVFGLRPSQGRVPSWPRSDAFFAQLVTEGPIARNVADLALLLGVQSGHDPRAPLSLSEAVDWHVPLDADLRGRRVGWLGDLRGHLPMEEDVIATCEAALKFVAGDGPFSRHDRADVRLDAALALVRGAPSVQLGQ